MAFFDFLKLDSSKDFSVDNFDFADLYKTVGTGAVLGQNLGLFGSDRQPDMGYQGTVPKYTAVRDRVANTFDPNRRPGSGGQRYFSDIRYVPEEGDVAAARTASMADAEGLAALNLTNPAKQIRVPRTLPPPTISPNTPTELPTVPTAESVTPVTPSPFTSPYQYIEDDPTNPLQVTPYKTGGIAELRTKEQRGGIAELGSRKQRYLDGETDGMADKVPATIDNEDPAALSDGEYVIPADVVSHLGNGNSDAGAKVLDEMLSRVREARTGETKQAPEINPKEFLPV